MCVRVSERAIECARRRRQAAIFRCTRARLRAGLANLWASEVDDRAVVLKQVNFLDCWNVIHAETLERVLQAFVICSGGLVHGLLLPPNRALASSSDRGL